MTKMSATVKYIDVLGRVVLLTDANAVVILYENQMRGAKVDVGDQVQIECEDWQKRMSDWMITIPPAE